MKHYTEIRAADYTIECWEKHIEKCPLASHAGNTPVCTEIVWDAAYKIAITEILKQVIPLANENWENYGMVSVCIGNSAAVNEEDIDERMEIDSVWYNIHYNSTDMQSNKMVF